MSTIRRAAALLLTVLLLLGSAPAAHADDPGIPLPNLPDVPIPSVPGVSDCKEAPTPESPGTGLAGFFGRTPETLPPAQDPFKEGSTTTINEQYGYAGLRWRTYDLGCGPDAVRNPDAVVGTSVANWVMQAPIALTALTGSLTQVAFQPKFLGAFDPVVERVSAALHDSLFASWIPAVIALLGFSIVFTARKRALATTASAVAWALLVVIAATALFRWPVVAGQVADATVTSTIGEVVGRLDGESSTSDPGMAVSSQVEEAILYRAWLAGTLGSPDSATARKYGPALFKSQALTWREAAEAQKSPDRAKAIIESKQKQWTETADKIKAADPEAYENLQGKRSETRVGYAVVAALGTFLSLPFLLLSALLMLGCFLIVRLAVMLFPAFAVLGIFPATRGLVTGLGRTVGAAVVNSIIFGIGAGVTVAVLGILFHPGGGSPAWLSLVLMPLFSLIMWQALRPFRRLTAMVSPDRNHFSGTTDSMAQAKRGGKRMLNRGVAIAAGAASGGAAGAAVATALEDDRSDKEQAPERAEARVGPEPKSEPAETTGGSSSRQSRRTAPGPVSPAGAEQPSDPARSDMPFEAKPVAALPEGFVPRPTSRGVPPPPTEPEWYDGEAVYPIYRPETEPSDEFGTVPADDDVA